MTSTNKRDGGEVERCVTHHDACACRQANVERDLTESRAEVERLWRELHSRDRQTDEVVRAIHAEASGHKARAERAESHSRALAGALRGLLGSVDDLTSYMAQDDEIGYRPCCNVLSYNDHANNCAITQARTVLEQEPQEWIEIPENLQQHRRAAENPDWPEFDLTRVRVHDWRSYVPPGVREQWDALPLIARCVAVACGEMGAAAEEWE